MITINWRHLRQRLLQSAWIGLDYSRDMKETTHIAKPRTASGVAAPAVRTHRMSPPIIAAIPKLIPSPASQVICLDGSKWLILIGVLLRSEGREHFWLHVPCHYLLSLFPPSEKIPRYITDRNIKSSLHQSYYLWKSMIVSCDLVLKDMKLSWCQMFRIVVMLYPCKPLVVVERQSGTISFADCEKILAFFEKRGARMFPMCWNEINTTMCMRYLRYM